jgi:hypothetical protein
MKTVKKLKKNKQPYRFFVPTNSKFLSFLLSEMAPYIVTHLRNNEQGITNCCYMHPGDLVTRMSDSDILCAIWNSKKTKMSCYNIRPSIDIPKGHIGMGLLQRASSDVLTGELVDVKVFNPLKSMRMNTVNFAITSLAKSGTQNTINIEGMIAHIKKTYNMHMFHLNDKFAVCFNNLMYLVQVVDFTTDDADDACVFRNMYGQLCEKTVVTLSSTVVATATRAARAARAARATIVTSEPKLCLRRSSRLSKLPRVNYKD